MGRGYYYLSEKDSDLYDKVKDSEDPKDKVIKELLEEKAEDSYLEHCRSSY